MSTKVLLIFLFFSHFFFFFNAKFPIFPIFLILSFLFSYFFEQPCAGHPGHDKIIGLFLDFHDKSALFRLHVLVHVLFCFPAVNDVLGLVPQQLYSSSSSNSSSLLKVSNVKYKRTLICQHFLPGCKNRTIIITG